MWQSRTSLISLVIRCSFILLLNGIDDLRTGLIGAKKLDGSIALLHVRYLIRLSSDHTEVHHSFELVSHRPLITYQGIPRHGEQSVGRLLPFFICSLVQFAFGTYLAIYFVSRSGISLPAGL